LYRISFIKYPRQLGAPVRQSMRPSAIRMLLMVERKAPDFFADKQKQ
jgi:hypothetical protein